jgi:hypothetical protein
VAPAPGRQSLADKVRGDWDRVRRGFASAGDDLASAFRDLGRRLGGE